MPDYDVFFKGFTKPPKGSIVIDPFADDESTAKWLDKKNILIAYSAKESHPLGLRLDTLRDPPKYAGTYVVTTPPWHKKGDIADNTLFDRYGTDNLYKCFIRTLLKSPALGGSILVPLTFLVGVRDSEKKRRQDFFTLYKPLRFNVFQTIWQKNLSVAINFVARLQREDGFWPAYLYPSGDESILIPSRNCATLSGQDPYETGYKTKPEKRISIFPDTSQISKRPSYTKLDIRVRTHDTVTQRAGLATDEGTILYVRGVLSKKAQHRLLRDFNEWLNNWRSQTNSLFMSCNTEGRYYISIEFAIEAMTRILWSYFKA